MAGKHRTKAQRNLQNLLKSIRQEHGLTQEALAVQLGKPQSFVSKYETGERRLGLPEIRDVCQATGVSLVKFVKRYEDSLI